MNFQVLAGTGDDTINSMKFFHARNGEEKLFAGEWEDSYPRMRELMRNEEKPGQAVWLDEKAVFYNDGMYKKYSSQEALKCAVADFLKTAGNQKPEEVALIADNLTDRESMQDLIRGCLVGGYRFQDYKKEKDAWIENLQIMLIVRAGLETEMESVIGEETIISSGINLARDLVNRPANYVYPETLAETARSIAAESGMVCEVLDEKALAAQQYNGTLAVGRGSEYPPRMIILRYQPENANGKHLALVGKGVTFDTGGVSIKPSKNMHEMKGDMGGAAAVLGVMHAVGRLKPDVTITAIVPTAENMVDARAQRPGDIYQHKSGKYVQVDNTDAEGRLLLIDALHRAGEEGAEVIVDMATLTGSCMRALGLSVAGIMGTDPGLLRNLIEAAATQGEALWELPLVEEYREQLDTPVADIRNIGSANAGAITAGLFLREFVPEDTAWAHMDIAGVFYYEKGWKYYQPGASGIPVAGLLAWIKAAAAKE